MSAVVLDASVLVAILIEEDHGTEAARAVRGRELCAPSLLQFEVAQVLRRAALHGRARLARGAYERLPALPIQQFPFELLSDRISQLRANLSAYDAAYVALAERLAIPLLTLDRRLARAPGIRCEVLVPA